MMNDLRERLVDAAGEPARGVDLDSVEHRAHRLTRRRRAARAMSVVVVGALALSGALLVTSNGSDDAATHIAAPAPATPSSGEVFDGQGDRVQLPPGWYRSGAPLVPYLSSPQEILSVATFPLAPDDRGPGCDAQLPKGTLDAMQPADAFVWIVEPSQNPRVPANLGGYADPSQFPHRPAHFSLDQFQAYDCSGPTWSYPHATFRRLYFTESGRVIGAYVTLGDQVTPEREAQVMALLDSLELAGTR